MKARQFGFQLWVLELELTLDKCAGTDAWDVHSQLNPGFQMRVALLWSWNLVESAFGHCSVWSQYLKALFLFFDRLLVLSCITDFITIFYSAAESTHIFCQFSVNCYPSWFIIFPALPNWPTTSGANKCKLCLKILKMKIWLQQLDSVLCLPVTCPCLTGTPPPPILVLP